MSRPIKVSDELFAELQQDAVERGTTLQETLQHHLDAKNRSLDEFQQERDRLRGQAKGLGKRIDELTVQSCQEQDKRKGLEEEKAELITELEETRYDLGQLEEAVGNHKREAETLSAELDRTNAEVEEEKTKLNRTVNLLLVGAFVLVLSVVLRRLFPPPGARKPDEPGVLEPPVQYPW